ncbi:MAG TPA: hypothetical protein VLF59_03150 [Candidatus Saccharimonadales bacterium]|nr:hypothetical protein [Candidatus Saccharimonadales bacterium]
MFPDANPHQAPGPASLPQVPLQPQPVAPTPAQIAPRHDLEGAVTQIKTLLSQYGSNPYAFNAAFQQLKTQYLRDHYHIDPTAEK